MAEIQLLGLFHDVEQAARCIEQLHKLEITDNQITVLSNIPYKPEVLGLPKHRGTIGKTALFGAILGLITAYLLVAGTAQLYPVPVGNQPNVPIPPMLIIMFEVTMLGTMWAAFFGLLYTNHFPVIKHQIYNPKITEDSIGVVLEVDEKLAAEIEKVFNDNQAHQVQKEAAVPSIDIGMRRFWAYVVRVLVFAAVVLGLFVYDVFRIPFPSQMVNQESIGFQQGPRLAAPVQAVPVQGSLFISAEPVSRPILSSPASLQRGKILYSIHCVLCHGESGKGDGQIGTFFDRKPADLTAPLVQTLKDDDIYLIIYNGFGIMPSLQENLDPADGWDIINYVRTLK